VEVGKTTISTAFALYVKNYVKNVVLFDADINSHVGKSIGMDKIELGDRIEELRKIF
jgi:CobQ/CobB/MinD/ParA nucleotide binding domain protein